jgi:hypothetical protein
MYRVTTKITKQNLEDSFYTIADPITPVEIKSYWVTNYKENGKCLLVTLSFSSDQLELETVQIWADQASYEEYENDPILITGLFVPRSTYWQERNITGVVTSKENY